MTNEVSFPVERREEILKYLGLNPGDLATQALVQICERYGFDPLLKHVVLIGTGGKKNTYVTRDGLLHLAHQSKQLDGIVIVEEGNDSNEWYAVAEVYRKDMTHPFRYKGRYSKQGSNKKYGPEMAVKCAEVMALRRAFDVSLPTVEEQWDTHAAEAYATPGNDPVLETTTDSEGAVYIEVEPDAIKKDKPVIKRTPAVHDPRREIKSLMNSPAAEGHRSAFKEKFGHPDELNDSVVQAALTWAKQIVMDGEPF